MSTFIITTRNPGDNDKITVIGVDEDYPVGFVVTEYRSVREACAAAAINSRCQAWGYNVIEVP